MDEFGSPILGGVNAVRRTVSSSMFAPRQPQRQPDSITTNLLSQQSLQLTSVSQQLERISTQVTSLNSSLSGVKENLAISDQLERQREAENRKRERILAEQGLREGKESQLENKIQNALVQPLQKIAVKTQSTLGNLQKFFLILAGGWLTQVGIDIIQAQVEGNTDKLNQLKQKFVNGLLVIGGTVTALSIGLKNSFRLLGTLAGSISRVAFGGVLRVTLGGLRRLFSAIAANALGSAVGNFLTRGIGRTAANITTTAATTAATAGLGMSTTKKGRKMLRKGFRKITKVFSPGSSGKIDPSKMDPTKTVGEIMDEGVKNTKKIPTKKGFLSGIRNRAGNIGKKIVKTGDNIVNPVKNMIAKFFNKLPGKNILNKLLSTVGIKGGLKPLFKKFGGPVFGLVLSLASGDSIGKALAGVAGYAATSAVLAKLLSPIALLPIPGARLLYGALIFGGALFGESKVRQLYDGLMGMFGGGKESKTENNEIKPNANLDSPIEGMKFNNQNNEEDSSSLINPIKSKTSDTASEISDVDEGQPAIIDIPLSQSDSTVDGVGNENVKSDSATVPKIFFDDQNPHTLYGAATYGVGN